MNTLVKAAAWAKNHQKLSEYIIDFTSNMIISILAVAFFIVSFGVAQDLRSALISAALITAFLMLLISIWISFLESKHSS